MAIASAERSADRIRAGIITKLPETERKQLFRVAQGTAVAAFNALMDQPTDGAGIFSPIRWDHQFPDGGPSRRRIVKPPGFQAIVLEHDRGYEKAFPVSYDISHDVYRAEADGSNGDILFQGVLTGSFQASGKAWQIARLESAADLLRMVCEETGTPIPQPTDVPTQ